MTPIHRLTRGDMFLLVAAFLILAYVAILGIGAAWGGCHNPNAKKYSDQPASYDDCTVNGVRLMASDFADFVDRRHDDVTAISTLFIAIFTIVLATVTRRQAQLTRQLAEDGKIAAAAAKKSADAASRHAEAAVGVELPRLIVTYFSFSNLILPQNFMTYIQSPEIAVRLTNFGRTPAFIINQCIEVVPMPLLPEEPEYCDAVDFPSFIVVEQRGLHELKKRIWLDNKDFNDVIYSKSFLWCYGYVFYQDFLGDHHMARFCKRYFAKADGGYAFTEGSAPENYTKSY